MYCAHSGKKCLGSGVMCVCSEGLFHCCRSMSAVVQGGRRISGESKGDACSKTSEIVVGIVKPCAERGFSHLYSSCIKMVSCAGSFVASWITSSKK